MSTAAIASAAALRLQLHPAATGPRDAAAATGPGGPWIVADTVDLSEDGKRAQASALTKWPGPAPEGSAFHGRKTADGLWLDDGGRAVVLDPAGRTVLIGTANGRQIQHWGDILNDASGRYSDVDKARAYNQLFVAWQDGNPNFTADEKRAAAGIANNSDFISKIMAFNERMNALHQGGAPSLDRLIAWHDNEAADWERELLAGEREKWEAIKLVLDGLEARVRAGAFAYGDRAPQDGETRWLLAMFGRIGEVSSRPWEHPDLRAAHGAIRDELRRGYRET